MTDAPGESPEAALVADAIRIVQGPRQKAYGPPERNFERIARLWNAHLVNIGLLSETARGLTPVDVAALMRLVKEARLAETPDHYDSHVDIVGYALCAWGVITRAKENT
jgi:hypothetical protein